MEDLYFFEYLFEDVAIFSPIISVLNILTIVFLMLYMHYTAKYKNHDLSVAWYILGFFFPLPVAIVFAVKSKNFRHENTKVCSQCGDKYPETFTMCSRCLIDLPELDDPSRMKKKKLGKVFCGLFWLVTVASVVAVVWLFTTVVMQTMDMMNMDYSNRIGVETVAGETLYFDKEGNAYSDPNEVPIYGKNGEVYTYTVKEIDEDAADDGLYYYEECLYVSEDGEEYDALNCYVTEDGWFYYDKDYEVYWDDSDYDYEADYSDDVFDLTNYRYYNDKYIDDEGNIYYYADEVSWNEKGEIITAENDPNPPVVEEVE